LQPRSFRRHTNTRKATSQNNNVWDHEDFLSERATLCVYYSIPS